MSQALPSDGFFTAVSQIAEIVWQKYGPGEYNSPAAYQEIKSLVQYSSWIVSDSHAKLVVEFTKQQENFGSTRSRAIEGMIALVWKELERYVAANEAACWKVRFVVQKRYLTFQDIFEDHRPPKQPMASVANGIVTSKTLEDDVAFPTEIEAEEAAEGFCRGYIVAGMSPPKIQIVAFNHAKKEIPRAKLFLPSQKAPSLKKFPYGQEDIPSWCRMGQEAHEVAGGCWGISSGEVYRKGKDHCETCECYDPKENNA